MENTLRPADNRDVKKRGPCRLVLVVVPLLPAAGWRILYAEQYYRLYHETLHHYPEDAMEDIQYLELALKADFAPFANPLYALATIHDTTEWERYRNLFYMHVNLKLIYLYLTLGSKYDKMVAYFYNYPWKRQNLESLDTAEKIYRVAYGYWTDAQKWSAMAWAMQDIHLPARSRSGRMKTSACSPGPGLQADHRRAIGPAGKGPGGLPEDGPAHLLTPGMVAT